MSVCEVLFYHLESATLPTVLPGLLEKTLARGWKAIVAASKDGLDALDQHLWTYRDESFLPHNSHDGAHHPEREPILLVGDSPDIIAARPNGADVLFMVQGAQVPLQDMAQFTRTVVIFDGRNEDDLQGARTLWKMIKDEGDSFAPTYWRQSEQGRWEKQA